MNKKLEHFARQTLKEGLALCTEAQRMAFRRMYAFDYKFDNGRSYIPNGEKPKLNKDIVDVVDDLSEDRLGKALEQVHGTLVKNRAESQE